MRGSREHRRHPARTRRCLWLSLCQWRCTPHAAAFLAVLRAYLQLQRQGCMLTEQESGWCKCLQVLPGGRLLASSDETGNVAVADLRMLGNTRQPVLWQVCGPNVRHSVGCRGWLRCRPA